MSRQRSSRELTVATSTRIIEETCNALRSFLTPSCTAALEMGAIVADLKPGDEVILPSYTFSSTANAVVLQGAKL